MNALHIRPYQNADEDPLIELWFNSTVSGQDFLPPDFWEAQKKPLRETYIPMTETWVAEKEGQMLGFISLLDHLIVGLFVDHTQQSKGVGTALVDKAMQIREMEKLAVEVFEKNKNARGFYEKCGFQFSSQYLHEESGEMTFILKMS